MNRKSSELKPAIALFCVCTAVLMIVLDATIVTVALPSIGRDLHIADNSLAWLLNAYMLTFGGFLMLGGRLGDLCGRRRIFLLGTGVFTVASFLCGISSSAWPLLVSRAIQGLGGAIVSAVAISLITDLFPDPRRRATALGIYGSVCAAAGGIGELLGGSIVQLFSWHWIFLVNLPIGAAVCVSSSKLLPPDYKSNSEQRVDMAGAALITTAMTLLVYTFVGMNDPAGKSIYTLGLFCTVGLLLMLFIRVESQTKAPLIPLRLFTLRNFASANVLGVMWAAGSLGWFVICALYLQRILGYSPLHVGLAFVPAELVTAAASVGLSAKLVMSLGARVSLSTGLALIALGLSLFAAAPTTGTFLRDVLPGMVLFGLGSGLVSTPLLLIALDGIRDEESGLGSGILNTAFVLGGALGLAVLLNAASARALALRQVGIAETRALLGGYHFSLSLSVMLNAVAAILCPILIRRQDDTQ